MMNKISISLSIDPVLQEDIMLLAKEKGRNFSNYVNRVLQKHVDKELKNKNDKPKLVKRKAG